MRRTIYFLFSILCCIWSSALSSASDKAEYSLVVHADVAQDAFSTRQIRSLFTLKKRVWSDGAAVQLVTLSTESEQHQDFVKSVLNLFPYQLTRLWERQVFSGSALRPIQAKSTEDLIDIVSRTNGSIGYIQSSELKAQPHEKVIFIPINR